MDNGRESWGFMPDGREVELFSLTNGRGMTATVTNYGATLVGLTAPDRHGRMADVVLGYDSLTEYVNDSSSMGCTVGRVANRISHARFELGGVEYRLPANLGENHLHGGPDGLQSRLWEANLLDGPEGRELHLTYHSPDGEQGYPGALDVTVIYTLTEKGLRIRYQATTDRLTVVNLTNHAYFNLSGTLDESAENHVLTLNASACLASDRDLIPTGELVDVAGTPLDFTRPKTLSLEIDAAHPLLKAAQGYDHCFVIDGGGEGPVLAAQVFHGGSGRVLEVHTTQPCVQLYSGNHLPERMTGKLGALYGCRHGFCLETQGYVDAPNRNEFPAITLAPGEQYKQVTEYRLSTM